MLDLPVPDHPVTLADWLAHAERLHPQAIDMGLERVQAVARRMALAMPCPVITVAGTNGKGSTCAMLESIYGQAGYRTGVYTSPHLVHFEERCRVDGRPVDAADLVPAMAEVEQARRGQGPDQPEVSLTYFEFTTLAILRTLARADIDVAILEVGLGGRLDAVNIVDPDVAVITTVDLDHQDWLGSDREAIGAEKAGIARAWTPLVLGDDDPPSSVLGHAYAIGAPAIRIGCDFFIDRPDDAPGWRWREVGCELALPWPSLAAPAQLRNAAVAIAALRALPVDLPDAAFAEGVATAHVPGRLQRFERDGVEVVVDVGHNPQAARGLAAWLDATPPAGRRLAVYAALADKDARGVVDALAGRIDRWHLAGLVGVGPRSQPVEALAARLADTPAAHAAHHDDVARALDAAIAEAAPGDRILVFGSFHTAAEACARLAAA